MTTLFRRFCSNLLALAAAFVLLNPTAARADDGVWQKLKSFAHEQKNEAVSAGRGAITETNRQIAALKKQAKHTSDETKAAHQQNMKDLAAKKKAAQGQLAKLEKAGAKTWESTKEGAANAYRDLQLAYEKAAASARK